MKTVKMKWSNTTICMFEHGANQFLLIEIPVIDASELSSGVFLPSENSLCVCILARIV